MCGLVGLLSPNSQPDQALVERLRDRLTHRGPDAAGLWSDGRLMLGHRRLAVVDLSSHGDQPMHSANGRWVLAYNGEIYNAPQLRTKLSPHPWRGSSDTEVLLEAISRWGLEQAVNACVGMFALALWDKHTQTLLLARDRLGIKPLYYGWIGEQFVFASELRAIRQEFANDIDVDRSALSGYLRHGYVPDNASILSGVNKLPPATMATLDFGHQGKAKPPTLTTYWTLAQTPITQLETEQALPNFLTLAREAVACRLLADVPVGAFLSGGLDSSLVCALMTEASNKPINTFTMGFDDRNLDESPQAAAIAKYLGAQHHCHQVTPSDLVSTVDRLPTLLDEPFADSSIIPTALLSALARDKVTVALSGDGGDELFWGYRRYQYWHRLQSLLARTPGALRHLASTMLDSTAAKNIAGRLPWPGKHPLSNRLQTLAELCQAPDEQQLYRSLISLWKNPNSIVINGAEPTTLYNNKDHWTHKLEPWRRISAQDLHAYLPNDILNKVDRASMAVSLEARVPLLDHRLVEYCFGLPEPQIRNPKGSKWLLRQAVLQYLPEKLIDRPKQGFSVPLDAWLRGPLRHWMVDLLSESRLQSDGYFQAKPITHLMDQHLSGRADWGPYLWTILMFQVWLHQG